MPTYASAMTTWLDWQKHYRLGVILVLPREPVRSQINMLCAKYDSESHKNVEAHISLTVPLQKEPDDNQWAEFERIAELAKLQLNDANEDLGEAEEKAVEGDGDGGNSKGKAVRQRYVWASRITPSSEGLSLH